MKITWKLPLSSSDDENSGFLGCGIESLDVRFQTFREIVLPHL